MKISLYKVVKALSEAMDLISNTVTGHHKKVAYISLKLAQKLNLSREEKKKIVLAALMHDIGVFHLNQRFSDLTFDKRDNFHAEVGYLMLNDKFPVKEIPEIIRYHHQEWRLDNDHVLSSIIYLADRITVLTNTDREILTSVPRIKRVIKNYIRRRFWPEAVDAFLQLAEKEYFWLDLTSVDYINNFIESYSYLYEDKINISEIYEISKIYGHLIDFRSPFTATHTEGVASIAQALASSQGFSDTELEHIKIAGYLHDLGKLAVPVNILEKPGKLNKREWGIMRTHTYYTYQVLSQIEEFKEINEWASYHHEKLTGEGYPFHLKGEDLSLGSRIMSVADIFTAITENRPYRKGMEKEKAKKILSRLADDYIIDEKITSYLLDNLDYYMALRETIQQEAASNFNQFKIKVEKAKCLADS